MAKLFISKNRQYYRLYVNGTKRSWLVERITKSVQSKYTRKYGQGYYPMDDSEFIWTATVHAKLLKVMYGV